MFLAVILVPELFRKLRETHRKNSHQVWSKSDGFRTSYEQKTYFKMANNRPCGANNESPRWSWWSWCWFSVVPGVVLVVVDVVASHYVY